MDKSISPLQTNFGPVFGDEAVQRVCSSRSKAPSECFCEHIHPSASDMTLLPQRAFLALKRKPLARGTTAPRAPSIVDGFCRRPWLVSAADSVASEVCLLVLVAVTAPLIVIGGAAQNDNMRATTRGGPAGVGIAEPWPRCGVRALTPHVGPSDSPAR